MARKTIGDGRRHRIRPPRPRFVRPQIPHLPVVAKSVVLLGTCAACWDQGYHRATSTVSASAPNQCIKLVARCARSISRYGMR